MSESGRDGDTKEVVGEVNLVDLLSLTPQRAQEFRERVQDGNVNILVHPFFREENPDPKRLPSEEYKQDRDTLIQQSLDSNTTPLVIFEELENLPLLAQRLSRYKRGTIYFVSTKAKNPTPVFAREGPSDNFPWDSLTEILKRLDVRCVTVGGQYLYYAALEDEHGIWNIEELNELADLKKMAVDKPKAKEWLNKDLLPYGCAGLTVQKLLTGGFDVAISSIFHG